MVVAVFSDVHGNLPALEHFVKNTRRVADAYVCLGDIVNYAPWNDECLELVHSLPRVVVLEGNHERLFLGVDPINHEIQLVQDFYRHSIETFSRLDLITSLPVSCELGSYSCIHTIGTKKVYADTKIEIARNHMIGHTHHQFKNEHNGYVIANCGSVGQNRACVELLSYALYDTDLEQITFCENPYPVDRLMRELTRRGYSEQCIEYYERKRMRAGV
jgi:predicted phosphodiesterase